MNTLYIWYIFTFIGILVPYLNASDSEEFDGLWSQSKIGGIYDKLYSKCEEKQIQIDKYKINNEHKSCVRTLLEKNKRLSKLAHDEEEESIVTQLVADALSGKPLTMLQIQTIKQSVGDMCEALPSIMNCSKPGWEYLIHQCSNNIIPEIKIIEYIELIIQSICKNDGENFAEFFANDGISCLTVYIEGAKCIPETTIFSNYHISKNTTVKDLCDFTKKLHTCISHTLDTCRLEAPSRALHLILDDVWSWPTTYCLKNSALRITTTLQCTRLVFLVFILFLKSFI